eukprot:CAMPEP_0197306864 /NCGR_PEP_ID=MMETSP0891-20130614/4125_1 /TAXON_ID=44058 ORGANISM="Aureoumbra lagunensis, Strain CCMP1510" /NCGR_SAMPLE_ID=MMETSP0891 /ASSEMBLY_ACC=CAM_ASM_000534 /LENGTH=42 /DNA_ID= /DNA_START= /DNA_END= /DNA_ORIENTATION=
MTPMTTANTPLFNKFDCKCVSAFAPDPLLPTKHTMTPMTTAN